MNMASGLFIFKQKIDKQRKKKQHNINILFYYRVYGAQSLGIMLR